MNEPQRYEPSPRELDLDHPSVARVYDYMLGGDANWAIDREFGNKLLASHPLLPKIARANRLFLHRVVRHLARLGIRQFIDIGAGIPTMGNTHEIAQEAAADCRVVYIDNEPVAVAHANALLHQDPNAARHAVINADLRSPDRLWQKVKQAGTLDLDKPVAVLIIAVLHVQQPGSDGADLSPAAVARYRELMPAGSYLAISHVTDDGVPDKLKDDLRAIKKMFDNASSPVILRSGQEIQSFFGDFTLLDPGMCWTPQWHPEEATTTFHSVAFSTPSEAAVWAGVGRKP